MVDRQTLKDGDVWSSEYANSAGYPIPDGGTSYGSGPRVIDEWLDNAPDQIKARFYGYYNRAKVVQSDGRSVNYGGAAVLLADGTQVTFVAGKLTLPANSTNFIFIDSSGAVTFAGVLPSLGVPLAVATTSGSAVTTLLDIRLPASEQVRPLSASASGSGSGVFEIGDIKESARLVPSTGWVICNNNLYDGATYPDALAAIGTVHNRPGDPSGWFRVPGLVDRTVVGSGGKYPLGSTGGAEAVQLTSATTYKHSHIVDEVPHTHGSDGGVHSHGVNDPGHNHPLLVSNGGIRSLVSLITTDSAVPGVDSSGKAYSTKTDTRRGGDIIALQGSNVSVLSNSANVSIQPAKTNLTTQTTGQSQPHENMMPYVALNKFIRLF